MNPENPERKIVQYPLIERLRQRPVLFLAEKSTVDFAELENLPQTAEADTLYALDFYISGVEDYEQNGFFKKGKIVNLDHHSKARSMERQISTTNLAMAYMQNFPGYSRGKYEVVTHHVDCDSVLSTLILRGVLPPEERFGRAAIAADHTGEANNIADLLQAIKRGPEGKDGDTATAAENMERFKYVMKNFQNFLNGLPLEESAQKLLDHRLAQRAEIAGLRRRGEFSSAGKNSEVIFLPTQAEGRLDPTLLIGQFPEAKIIFTYYQPDHAGQPGNYIFNYRLGQAGMAAGLRLDELVQKAGLVYGGRWNGGSNKRKSEGRGSEIAPLQTASLLAEKCEKS